MIVRYFRYAVITAALIVVQTGIFRYLTIAGVAPDILAIWGVYLALKEGRLEGTLWGFLIGLGMDIMSGSFLGLTALTKTFGGFTAGSFYEEEKLKLTLAGYKFLLIVFLSSIVQHIVYFILVTRGSDITLLEAFLELGISTTLYTTLIAIFPVMIIARKSVTVNVE